MTTTCHVEHLELVQVVFLVLLVPLDLLALGFLLLYLTAGNAICCAEGGNGCCVAPTFGTVGAGGHRKSTRGLTMWCSNFWILRSADKIYRGRGCG